MRRWAIVLVIVCVLIVPACEPKVEPPPGEPVAEETHALAMNPRPDLSPIDVLEAVKEHDTAFRARIVEVGRAPGFWSGPIAARQAVRYKVLQVYFGALVAEGAQVEVQHIIVGGGPAEDPREPRLNPLLIKPDREVILFAQDHFPGLTDAVYVCGDEPASMIFPPDLEKGWGRDDGPAASADRKPTEKRDASGSSAGPPPGPWCGTNALMEANAFKARKELLKIHTRIALLACEVLRNPESSDAERADAKKMLQDAFTGLKELDEEQRQEDATDT